MDRTVISETRIAKSEASVNDELAQAIREYLLWIQSEGFSPKTRRSYRPELKQFLLFIKNRRFSWKEIFTLETLERFKKVRGTTQTPAIKGLSRYLYEQGRIVAPMRTPNPRNDLPAVYEEYLIYHEKSRQIPYRQIKRIKRVLAAFHHYLERNKIQLAAIRIEQIDAFQAEFNAPFAPATCSAYRSMLRSFLTYLYQERRLLHKDLAPLVVGAPIFSKSKPPKFLHPQEVKRLFASLTLSSPTDLRTHAMIHLAYFLGLRPREISLIRLDDISFSKAELCLEERKTNKPVTLPVPEEVIKTIALYLVGVRPKSKHRTLFLSLNAPYRPITANAVGYCISDCMRRVGLSSSAYWLRHTYAQNLLEAGVSIYEIKEMLGHDSIESTRKYLHIHTRLMREVLFDEPL